ncbi:hypothetical protein SESBI_17671 [Sesbania bispinosa]|nr:hypothetical protein SESBI_17671 [Sesbania bispinosa]
MVPRVFCIQLTTVDWAYWGRGRDGWGERVYGGVAGPENEREGQNVMLVGPVLPESPKSTAEFAE